MKTSFNHLMKLTGLNAVLDSIDSNDIIGRLRFLFFRGFSLFIILSVIAVTIDVNLTVDSPLNFTFPLLAILFTANYFMLGVHRNFRLSYIILISLLFLEIHIDCYFAGGVNDSATFFYAALLIGTFMLLGTRVGFVFSFLAATNQVYFYYISEHTSWVTDYLAKEGSSAVRQDYTIVGVIALAAVAGMLIHFERSKNMVLNSLSLSRLELTDKNKMLKESEDQLKSYLQQMKAVNEELERKNHELDRFAYVVTHDLKSPLRAINNITSFIEEDAADKLSPETLNHLRTMRVRVNKMENLISDVLAYSKATQGSKEFTQFTFNNLVQDVIDIMHLPGNCKVQVLGGESVIVSDKTRLSQLILNLMVNAVKHHHKENIELMLSISDADKDWRFAIKDNGPGIAPRDHERIFQIFQMLGNNEMSGNSGIGLAIVKKVVDDLNGKIWIESSLGNGATFFFTLPKEKAGSSPAITPSHSHAEVIGKS